MSFYLGCVPLCPFCLCVCDSTSVLFVWQTLLRRMSLSHTKVTDWQSLYKVTFGAWCHQLIMCMAMYNILQSLLFVRRCIVQCASETQCASCPSPFSSSVKSARGSLMTCNTSPPSSTGWWVLSLYLCYLCDLITHMHSYEILSHLQIHSGFPAFLHFSQCLFSLFECVFM